MCDEVKLPFQLISLLKHVQLLKDCMDKRSLLFREETATDGKSQGAGGRALSTETRCFQSGFHYT